MKSIKVGWRVYEIHRAEPELSSGPALYGQADHDKQVITLRAANSLAQNDATLVHEVLHCIDDIYGLELSESMVERLGNALYTLIVDNGFDQQVKI